MALGPLFAKESSSKYSVRPETTGSPWKKPIGLKRARRGAHTDAKLVRSVAGATWAGAASMLAGAASAGLRTCIQNLAQVVVTEALE